MTKWSKVLSADSLENYDAWSVPDVTIGGVEPEEQKEMITADALEEIQKQAYEEAYKQGYEEGKVEGSEKGHAEGFEYGHQEGLSKAGENISDIQKTYESLINLLDYPLKQMDDQVESELVGLTQLIATQVLQHEIKTTPECIVQIIQKTMDLLPISARHVKIKCHPDDAALIAEGQNFLSLPERHEIIVDAGVHRGGCEVITDMSRIDATLSSRLKETIATLLNVDPDSVAVELEPSE
ncbi:MAG: flagellar assembly protein FliH [Methylococcales bacterium]|nr:flagellar assembly protein FliH [Methylococcales bacterium]